mgnify:CR=1 FL=1
MCAPISVTTQGALIVSSASKALLVNQILGLSAIISVLAIKLGKAIKLKT